MASFFKSLFGRQISHGSDTENPESFEQAFSSPQQPPQLVQQQQQAPQLMPQQAPSLDPYMMEQAPMDPYMQQSPGIPSMQQSYSSPGASEMRAAYAVSNQLVRDRMDEGDVKLLDDVKSTDIVCVQGTYDHIHLVLQAIGIPFAHIDPHKLESMELRPEQTIYVNCPSTFPKKAAKKLETFVREGGQLITTDWALKHVVEVAFPNTIKFNGKSTGDEVVSVEIVDKEDDVLKGFIDQEKDAAPVWWLESSSYPIKILDKSKVKVLVRSDELKRRYGDDPVIVSFEWGKGIVYHMISHFYLQRSETRTKKQGMASTAYASAQGASDVTMGMFEKAQTETPGMNYGMVQSAATSSEFVSRCLVRQKKRFAKK